VLVFGSTIRSLPPALQGLAYPKLPRVQVDILPAQGEQLTAAQPGRERQDKEGLQPLALETSRVSCQAWPAL